MKALLLFAQMLVAFSLSSQTINFAHINPNQFGSNGSFLVFKSGALVTNLTIPAITSKLLGTDGSGKIVDGSSLVSAGGLSLINGTAITNINFTNNWATKWTTSGVTNALAQPQPPVTLTDAATVATDASIGTHFRVTLAGNRTLGNPTNPTDGQRATWEVIQDGTGIRTLAMDTQFAFGTDITGITLTTNASKRDFITATYNSTATKWYVTGFVRGY